MIASHRLFLPKYMLFDIDRPSSSVTSHPKNRRPIRSKRTPRKSLSWWKLGLLGIAGLWGYKAVKTHFTPPSAIFVLGGAEEREIYAAKLAQKQPNLSVWVSGGAPQDYAKKVFHKYGVTDDRLHLDYQAQDTVTNFTTLVQELKAQGIESVYLVTSDNHMRRARVIGEIVFGSQGILIKPLSVPSQYPPEPWEKSFRDGIRSILWLFTGTTGEKYFKLTRKS